MSLTTIGTDTKTGAFTMNFAFPAIVSCNPYACVFCGREKGGCYALRGNCARHQKGKWYKNFELWRDNPEQFATIIRGEVANFSRAGGRYFRWFISGDIPDARFLDLMATLARENKTVKFLAFTKQDNIVNSWLAVNDCPKNLRLILSHWFDRFTPDNPHNLPQSQVLRGDEIVPLKSICPGNCVKCGFKCWNMRAGAMVYFPKH